ncbi:CBS domain-containing protein [Actinokineospora alba]|uniref:CBS domain-containing protein n=1 Tax=Actinokineospora alba TaxID=504798 RepID=A0A1H0FNH9_9PSEU|nr:CBS domain-containing protein [Actinokineospora alba]TDP69550.1 CBS domain protein [Actinokineospora alba]SDI14440.1 CBS domain-containing protein [Actinokineospora alba]SDN96207.1 CBS domain-containing protein [Actinokineospora alba]
MRAKDIMSSPVLTVASSTTVKEAASLLASHGFTAAPVVDEDDRLVGVVTEADLVRDRIPRDPRSLIHPETHGTGHGVAHTVGEVMSTPAASMSPGSDVADVAAGLLGAGHRSMPIVDGSRVVGIVTRRDLLRTIARDDEAVAKDVRHRLEIYGGSDRWTVRVADGVVTIDDEYDDETDRHVATVLARAVPGVASASCDRRASVAGTRRSHE